MEALNGFTRIFKGYITSKGILKAFESLFKGL